MEWEDAAGGSYAQLLERELTDALCASLYALSAEIAECAPLAHTLNRLSPRAPLLPPPAMATPPIPTPPPEPAPATVTVAPSPSSCAEAPASSAGSMDKKPVRVPTSIAGYGISIEGRCHPDSVTIPAAMHELLVQRVCALVPAAVTATSPAAGMLGLLGHALALRPLEEAGAAATVQNQHVRDAPREHIVDQVLLKHKALVHSQMRRIRVLPVCDATQELKGLASAASVNLGAAIAQDTLVLLPFHWRQVAALIGEVGLSSQVDEDDDGYGIVVLLIEDRVRRWSLWNPQNRFKSGNEAGVAMLKKLDDKLKALVGEVSAVKSATHAAWNYKEAVYTVVGMDAYTCKNQVNTGISVLIIGLCFIHDRAYTYTEAELQALRVPLALQLAGLDMPLDVVLPVKTDRHKIYDCKRLFADMNLPSDEWQSNISYLQVYGKNRQNRQLAKAAATLGLHIPCGAGAVLDPDSFVNDLGQPPSESQRDTLQQIRQPKLPVPFVMELAERNPVPLPPVLDGLKLPARFPIITEDPDLLRNLEALMPAVFTEDLARHCQEPDPMQTAWECNALLATIGQRLALLAHRASLLQLFTTRTLTEIALGSEQLARLGIEGVRRQDEAEDQSSEVSEPSSEASSRNCSTPRERLLRKQDKEAGGPTAAQAAPEPAPASEPQKRKPGPKSKRPQTTSESSQDNEATGTVTASATELNKKDKSKGVTVCEEETDQDRQSPSDSDSASPAQDSPTLRSRSSRQSPPSAKPSHRQSKTAATKGTDKTAAQAAGSSARKRKAPAMTTTPAKRSKSLPPPDKDRSKHKKIEFRHEMLLPTDPVFRPKISRETLTAYKAAIKHIVDQMRGHVAAGTEGTDRALMQMASFVCTLCPCTTDRVTDADKKAFHDKHRKALMVNKQRTCYTQRNGHTGLTVVETRRFIALYWEPELLTKVRKFQHLFAADFGWTAAWAAMFDADTERATVQSLTDEQKRVDVRRVEGEEDQEEEEDTEAEDNDK